VADDTLQSLARAAGLPIILRVRATRVGDADRIASETGGQRINGQSVEIRCAADAKMNALHQLSGLGAAVADIDITPPGLEELYRHYSGGQI
jgi:Cu-processing system ATP-binding protein